MRLSPQQIEIVSATSQKVMGRDIRVSVFGSRLDDHKQGGDLDLLIEAPKALSTLQRARVKTLLEMQLGLPVDVLIGEIGVGGGPFLEIARARSELILKPLVATAF